ncbi:MAG: hypothetical protein ACJ8F3_16530 [Xanthobacteraceae bacterium]
MTKMIIAAACSLALLVAASSGRSARSELRMAQASTSKDNSPAPPTAQRQKRRECAAKWTEQKAKTGVKGRVAYRKFMRECRKGFPSRS